MKNNKIIPLGLKGKQINERMLHLMDIKPINENKTSYVVELTKIGPDNKAYAIVRENHEYYIKITDKTSNILAEDFKYIGGLQNKKSESYPSYAKATKHLNLRFNSLAEAFDKELTINVLEDDDLLSESGIAGFSNYGGNGFSGSGNLEGNSELYEEEEEDETKETIDEVDTEEEIELTEEEAIIEAMLTEDDEDSEEEEEEESVEESIDRLTEMLDGPSDDSSKIKSLITTLTKNNQDITANNISVASLFVAGGTVSEESAAAYLKKKA